MNKSIKTRIIRNILEKPLEKHGFRYKGFKDKSWLFIDDSGEVLREIEITEYRYDSSYYTLLLSGTSAVTASMLDSSEKLLNEYWRAETQEKFQILIEKFLKLIETNGLDLLKEVSKPDYTYRILSRVARDVFEKRTTIFKGILHKYPELPTDNYSLESISKWFDLFDKEYTCFKQGNILELNEDEILEFEEVVTFLAEMLEKHLYGVWVKFETEEAFSFVIDNMATMNKMINIVAVVGSAINRGDIYAIRFLFEDLYRNKK